MSFHRAFGRARFLDGRRSGRGTLDRSQLLAGASDLLGEAYADDARRGWGIAFPSLAEKAAHDSELGRFTPLRACGLLGQTFEIEVVAGTAAGRPLSPAAT